MSPISSHVASRLFAGYDAGVGSEEAGRYAGLEGEEILVGIRRVLSGPHLHVVAQLERAAVSVAILAADCF